MKNLSMKNLGEKLSGCLGKVSDKVLGKVPDGVLNWWSRVNPFEGVGQKEFKLRINRADVPGAIAIVLLFSFAFSFVAGSVFMKPNYTNAVTGLGLAGSASMTLSSLTDAVELSVMPNPAGAIASASHTLNAATNVPSGYKLSLSASAMSGGLTASNGTVTDPTALTNNTWGFALASTGAVGVVNAFDASYTVPTPSSSSKWANPTAGGVTIKNTSQLSGSDSTTVYFGAKANIDITAGTYSSTAEYTALANIENISTPSIDSVNPISGSIAGGTQIEIVGSGFTVNDASVTTAVTVGGANCTSVSISSNTPTTGKDTIYCNTPAGTAGARDVAVTTWAGTATKTGGFTYIVPAVVTYVSPDIASTTAGSESGPQFTIVGSGFTGATGVKIGGLSCGSYQVISDTQIACEGATVGLTTGDKAVSVVKGVDVASMGTVNVNYASTNYPTLQSSTAYNSCTTTASLFRDERDSQLYYVKKMEDNKCWMVDNLKYAGFGELSQESGKYLTVDGTNAQSTENSDVAKYVDPGATAYCMGTDNKPTNTATECGYLYNWYAATNGTGTYNTSTQGNQASGNICPTNFRLPSATSGTGGPTTNGTSTTVADFPVLNASMAAGALTTGNTTDSTTTRAGWQPSGAWGGSFSGGWSSGLYYQGSNGYFWSSTASSATYARLLYFYSSLVYPGNSNIDKYRGFAVRCVMDEPEPVDVSPTTGWAGDTITITGGGFTNIASVTVGGTACASWEQLSGSRITCVLPSKTAGTSNEIVVTNEAGTNLTNASTYTHMKITYFNPSSSTVSIGGTTYNYFANGFTGANCGSMTASNAAIGSEPAASLAYVRDTRNGQVYRVKKMVDGKCWMVDSLKYSDSTMTFNNTSGRYNTVDGTDTESAANWDKKFYNNPMSASGCYGTSDAPVNSLTRCGYLYNWYAATNGTGTYNTSTQGNQASGNICPTNFRLPSSYSGTSGPTTNGTSATVADFPVLNASMNAGSLTTGSTTSYPTGWRLSGAWGGSVSGAWGDGLGSQGSSGYFWSSTAFSAAYARYLYFNSSGVSPASNVNKYSGRAVRCVIEEPDLALELPAGSNPSNIVSTNPAVLDVYPTTGWENDVVAITSNAAFLDVTAVSVGGTACKAFKVMTASLIACRLPAKTAGSSNDIVVTSGGTNVTNASTYTHMKITYFNPSSSTVTIGGTTYNYYPNGFTSTNCSSMTASNAVIGSTPASGIAYFRDTRNKQVYKVKKMIDGKCWMVDNLKYKDAAMTYNNGDHLANGGSGAYNTVNESSTQSATNSDKKFYNNPMSASGCYGTSNVPANSLTKCGYLYNWYAATGGTGTYNASTTGNQASGNICPTNFRLPSSKSGTGGATTNGTGTAVADFPVLNASMVAGSLTTGDTTVSSYAGWQSSGAWGGSFSGYWDTGLSDQGSNGNFWSSTASSATSARYLVFSSSGVGPGSYSGSKYDGRAVRCVLP